MSWTAVRLNRADERADGRSDVSTPVAYGNKDFTSHGGSLRPNVRTRHRSPHTNGVIERWFEALKYERLYREDVSDGVDLAEHVAAFTDEYNTVRPHEALHWRRPLDTHLSDPTLKPEPAPN